MIEIYKPLNHKQWSMTQLLMFYSSKRPIWIFLSFKANHISMMYPPPCPTHDILLTQKLHVGVCMCNLYAINRHVKYSWNQFDDWYGMYFFDVYIISVDTIIVFVISLRMVACPFPIVSTYFYTVLCGEQDIGMKSTR